MYIYFFLTKTSFILKKRTESPVDLSPFLVQIHLLSGLPWISACNAQKRKSHDSDSMGKFHLLLCNQQKACFKDLSKNKSVKTKSSSALIFSWLKEEGCMTYRQTAADAKEKQLC